MSTTALLVDLGAILFMIVGGLMVLAQGRVRRWWRVAGGRPARPRTGHENEDPAHYALIIFGMMIFAFGLIIFAFTTTMATIA